MASLVEQYAAITSPKAKGTTAPEAMDAPEGESIVGKAMETLITPVERVANLIDLPDSSFRDLVAGLSTGDFRKYNPFDQWLTPLSPENRATGRDLLQIAGAVGPNDPNRWEWSDITSGLAEIAASPTTYVTGGLGALTKAGRLIKSAGALPKTVGARLAKTAGQVFAEQPLSIKKDIVRAARSSGIDLRKVAGEKLATGAKIGIPFTNIGVNVGSGPVTKAIGKGVDVLSKAVGELLPVRIARSMLDPAKGQFGMVSKPGQKLSEDLYEKRMRTLPAIKERAFRDVDKVETLLGPLRRRLNDDAQLRKMVSLAEELAGKKGHFTRAATAAAKHYGYGSAQAGGAGNFARDIDALATAARLMRKTRDDLIRQAEELGMKVDRMHLGPVSYAPRRIHPDYLAQKTTRQVKTGVYRSPHMKRRRKALSLVPQSLLDDMLADKRYGDRRHGMRRVLQLMYQTGAWQIPNTSSMAGAVKSIRQMNFAEKLSDYIRKRQKKGVAHIYDINPTTMHKEYVESMGPVVENVKVVHDFYLSSLVGPKDPGVKLTKALAAVGLKPMAAINYLSKKTGVPVGALRKMRVDESAVKAAKTAVNPQRQAEWFRVLGETLDKYLINPVKSLLTVPWTDFHLRNLAGGQFNWLASGLISSPSDLMRYLKAVRKAVPLIQEGESNKIVREAIFNNVLGTSAAEGVDLGTRSTDFWNVRKTYGETTGNVPVRLAKTWFGTGNKTAAAIEFMNRMPGYIYLREKGYSPYAAAREVDRIQFNYDQVTPAERQYFRRLIPFWTFMKKNLAMTARTLAEMPGGLTSQVIRSVARSHGEDHAPIPQYIAGTTAIPVGKSPDGTLNFITGLSLPHEAALPYLAGLAGDPRGAGLELLSSLHPLPKYLLEHATGQTFFQKSPTGAGRPMTDMYLPIGQSLANFRGEKEPVYWLGSPDATRMAEHAISSTPAMKLISRVAGLADARRPIAQRVVESILPTRVTSVSPDQQEFVAQQGVREMARRLGARKWESMYFPKEMIEEAEKKSPQTAELMKALTEQLQQAKRRAHKKRKEREKSRAEGEGKSATGRSKGRPPQPRGATLLEKVLSQKG